MVGPPRCGLTYPTAARPSRGRTTSPGAEGPLSPVGRGPPGVRVRVRGTREREDDMRAVVVYESMYGNTHLIADAIGRGLVAAACQVDVVPVDRAGQQMLADADLVVVGGPTHAHGISRDSTR